MLYKSDVKSNERLSNVLNTTVNISKIESWLLNCSAFLLPKQRQHQILHFNMRVLGFHDRMTQVFTERAIQNYELFYLHSHDVYNCFSFKIKHQWECSESQITNEYHKWVYNATLLWRGTLEERDASFCGQHFFRTLSFYWLQNSQGEQVMKENKVAMALHNIITNFTFKWSDVT